MMTLGTGSRAGFTFFEIIVTVVILSVGLVVVYEGFIVSLGVYSYYTNSMAVESWMDGKLSDAEYVALGSREDSLYSDGGKVKIGGRDVQWRMVASPVVEDALYEMDLKCSWKEGRKDRSKTKVLYVVLQKDDEE